MSCVAQPNRVSPFACPRKFVADHSGSSAAAPSLPADGSVRFAALVTVAKIRKEGDMVLKAELHRHLDDKTVIQLRAQVSVAAISR